MKSNLDLARECGATFRSNRDGKIKQITMGPNRLDAFAERIRADAVALTVERKPLTKDQILQAYIDGPLDINLATDELEELARGVEAAHGINATQNGGQHGTE